jgi:signal transduction histidine kinase
MKFFTSLRFRLLLLVLMAVIPALAVTLYSGLEQRKLAREKSVSDAFHAIRLAAGNQRIMVESTSQLLSVLAAAPEIRTEAACAAYLAKLRSPFGPAAQGQGWLLVANADGRVTCASSLEAPLTDLAGQPFFARVLETRQPVIWQPIEVQRPGLSVLPLVLPVLDNGGNITQVVVGLLDMTLMMRPVVSSGLPELSALLVVDERGTVLMRYPGEETWVGETLPDAPIIRTILSGKTEGSSEARGIDQIERLYAFTPLDLSNDYQAYMAVGIPSLTAFAQADRILWQSLTWLGLAALLAFLAAWFGGEVFFLRVVSLTAERDAAENKLREANAVLEQRVAERTAELQQLLHVLEISNRDLQDFAFITSHDLQEPLRKIQAFGERLNDRYMTELNDEGRFFLERINASANRMQRMINDLLEYSRLTTRAKTFTPVDMDAVVRDVLSDLETRLEETGGTVVVDDLPVIDGDEMQMRQVMQNLIGNALKFRQPGQPPVVKISACLAEGNGDGRASLRAIICVEDNGIGFDEKYLDRIFVPFQRLHSKDEYEGSGIGLAICRKILDRHHGEILAHSQPGQGSQFIILLPIHQLQETTSHENT